MKKFLFILVFSVFGYSTAQRIETCKCDILKKSEDSLHISYSKNRFRSITKTKALKPPFKFISIKYLKNYAKSQDIVDSVEMKIRKEISKIAPDTILDNSYKIRDSIESTEYSKTYGDIPRPVIIKTGELNGLSAILYRTKSFYSPRYYLRISADKGKTWKNYYTGITGYKNYLFKSNSQYPLWKDKDNIQIEANIVRMIEEPAFPSHPEPEYETIKNNALITLNLKEILKDSDQDGINDIEEKLIYFTNPLSKDTDNDGINDFEDENPRYKNEDNDFSKLVEAIKFGDYPMIKNSDPTIDEFFIDLKSVHEDIVRQRREWEKFSKPREKSFLDKLDLNIITTDDENIRRMNTYGEKIIFLTSRQYTEFLKNNYELALYPNYSTIYKCDDRDNTYILTFDCVVIGETYLIKRTPEGWLVRIVNQWQT